MNIKEARAIVGKMIKWAMLANGVESGSTIETITEDLPTLIKANRMVEKANRRANERVSNLVKKNGSWSGKRKIQMIMADRAIAAVYVAANFKGDAENIEPIAQHGNNIMVVLDKRFVNEKVEE